ncbi:hypothetical protein SRHO_G00312800 [Serrasalmus rhombeus]
MLVEPEFIAAAVLVLKFKTSWTSDENIVKPGLDYIKDHLEEEASNQSPVDGSSASDDEDFFCKHEAYSWSGRYPAVRWLPCLRS